MNERGAIVLCKQQNAALRRGLHAYTVGFSVQHLRRREIPCSRICPRLSAPPWKGGVRSRADVLSCRFDGEECGHLVGMSSSPESRRSTADQRADGLPLRNVILT